MSTYLKINIAIIIIPLLLSFDKKVHFYTKWKAAFMAIIIPGFFFVVWDIWFTNKGVWSFNPSHLAGLDILGLPLEECLFFITVPYASLFTYETLKTYWPGLNPQHLGNAILLFCSVILLITAILFWSRIYTSFTFVVFTATVIMLVLVIRIKFSGRFLIAYVLIFFPFTLFNGMLTGSLIESPVVLYNNAENMNLRFVTIPVEDIFYGMLLILLNVSVYEFCRMKNTNPD